MEVLIHFRNKIIRVVYQAVKSILFLQDPENVHERMTKIGHLLGKLWLTRKLTSLTFNYSNLLLNQEIAGITFKNPVGLSAGFDKNAALTQILPSTGFGFEEVGSVTGEPCEGNPKPRLWRLKNSKSILVYYGLYNDGCEVISKRIKKYKRFFPIGISIAKTNSKKASSDKDAILDYVKSFKNLHKLSDYITINISCPNTYGGEPFTEKKRLNELLKEIRKIKTDKPIFIKLSPDISKKNIDEILVLTKQYNLTGIISTNLTKNRDNKNIKDELPSDKGGMSGKVVEDLANSQLEYIYKKTKGQLVLIGCGGVFTAEDAYKKIKSGASLIQLITGLIYGGPQTISEINQGLVKLLKKDGYSNISQAIGANFRK